MDAQLIFIFFFLGGGGGGGAYAKRRFSVNMAHFRKRMISALLVEMAHLANLNYSQLEKAYVTNFV